MELPLGGSGKRGLTTVEVLLAATVIAIALLGVAGLFPTAFRNVRAGGYMTKATAIARGIMETLLARPFTGLTAYHGVTTSDCSVLSGMVRADCEAWAEALAFSSTEGAGLPSGEATIAVCTAVPSCVPISGLARVTVTVEWVGGVGEKAVELQTYVAK